MQKMKEIWKELNGQPTDMTDKIVTGVVIFFAILLLITAYVA